MKDKCKCGYDLNATMYNPYNKVVQCHNCGVVYVPATKLHYWLNRIFKWWGE